MTLFEAMFVLVLVTLMSVAMLIGRIWGTEGALIGVTAPLALYAGGVGLAALAARRAERRRIPRARVVRT